MFTFSINFIIIHLSLNKFVLFSRVYHHALLKSSTEEESCFVRNYTKRERSPLLILPVTTSYVELYKSASEITTQLASFLQMSSAYSSNIPWLHVFLFVFFLPITGNRACHCSTMFPLCLNYYPHSRKLVLCSSHPSSQLSFA